jgi:hypothetical protein
LKNKLPNSHIDMLNYWAPLTSQVEALENTKRNNKKVRFLLPKSHRDTNGWQYRQQESIRIRNKRRPYENASMKRRRQTKGTKISLRDLKKGVMDGTIPSACADTGATSNAGTPSDPFEGIGTESTKVFSMPTGETAAATVKKKLLLDVREPANEVHIVPQIEQTLLSGSKFADAGYTAV